MGLCVVANLDSVPLLKIIGFEQLHAILCQLLYVIVFMSYISCHFLFIPGVRLPDTPGSSEVRDELMV